MENKIPSCKILTQRSRQAIYFKNTSAPRTLPEFTAAENIHLLPKPSPARKSLDGQPVFNGLVKGVVRIIKVKDDLSRLRKGEIIVTANTYPDFLPGMERAGAVVTDEGGMLSHAAITCREMKIPCIVGTKFATQLFIENDEVVVDANQGIITLIKRKH